jgi:hypothetical protein
MSVPFPPAEPASAASLPAVPPAWASEDERAALLEAGQVRRRASAAEVRARALASDPPELDLPAVDMTGWEPWSPEDQLAWVTGRDAAPASHGATPPSRDQSDQSDQRWPAPLAEAALHGLAGDYVRAVEPYSEADRPALLLHFLVGAGVMLGSRTHALAGDAPHPARLFGVVVGETSKGRKGSAQRPAERLLRLAGYEKPTEEGLTSGEGLIWAVRDPIEKYERLGRGADRRTELLEIDPGIADKRLLVIESEFASVLRVMEREGSTLSAVIRRAWDSGELRQLVKNSAAVATGAHVGIVGHVTRDEVRRYLTRTELASGFANRFLWVAGRRRQLLPDGESVPEARLVPIATTLATATTWAAQGHVLHRDEDAAARWHGVYERLSAGGLGLVGAATSRAEAQVLRLSVLYAALDRSTVITRAHLDAALAVWRYAAASARWVFGDAIGDPLADELLAALRNAAAGLDRTAIRDLFGRHQSRERIDAVLGRLLRDGLVARQDARTGGRPREVWSLRSPMSPRMVGDNPQADAWAEAPPPAVRVLERLP